MKSKDKNTPAIDVRALGYKHPIFMPIEDGDEASIQYYKNAGVPVALIQLPYRIRPHFYAIQEAETQEEADKQNRGMNSMDKSDARTENKESGQKDGVKVLSYDSLVEDGFDAAIMGTYDYTGAIPRLEYDHKEEIIPGNSRTVCPEDGANALEVLESIAKGAKLGFKIRTDRREGFHYFSVYKGKDRTDEQDEYPQLVFSTADGDILEQDFTHSVENIRNLAFVTGDKSVSRLGVWVPSYHKQIYRRSYQQYEEAPGCGICPCVHGS